ncbi:lipid-A-disaccharide synthase [Candidatus Photodesmus katoptron]|uniref:Lipid-A-disaccharide synthase n=1 Tax=Candidatus Photodesmus katoptron Akat1 TaxID=1236703 RepID=S3DHK6_9GAMM|nr:lipid-A-disaccharide synthase [Candidatus Photodesmus katoptron]EPE37917.1 lipid-A-disaccharide synthase [Candidatus Photodesmus katoptron Akat1]KEY90363.1 lipid-A-disaccharide synthase [Candidatus Photodesmus katoptron]
MKRCLTVGIVAGELSGDNLGEGLIKEIKIQYSNSKFVGIGGPKMKNQGLQSLYNIEELSTMGLFEIFLRLPRLLKIKTALVQYFTKNQPDIFIGIDSPDFNLRLESSLKQIGIKTIHYVSPSVWAWRPKRILKIASATDLVLVLFPFEKEFYDKYQISCKFIGHALADIIPMHSKQRKAQKKLQLDHNKQWLAVMPGSRLQEVRLISKPFIETCIMVRKKHPNIGFLVAAANEKLEQEFKMIWNFLAPDLEFIIVRDEVHNVIIASDSVLLASGTVSLECMLFKRPMVVGYKVNLLTAWLLKRLVRIKFCSLPNILAGEELVKEFVLNECTSEFLFPAVDNMLRTDHTTLIERFNQLHQSIRKNADKEAAKAVLKLISK